jgi:hypothetical protein
MDKYNSCIECGNFTIFNYLPKDVQLLICGYTKYCVSHLKCSQCNFIRKSNLGGFISNNYKKYDYHEEEDQKEFVDYLVNERIVKLYYGSIWDKLKWGFKVLNVHRCPDVRSFLVDLTFVNWTKSTQCKLAKNNKKILFEIPSNCDYWIQIILLLEKLSVINYVVVNDPYRDEDIVVEDDIDDDFVLGEDDPYSNDIEDDFV